MLGLGSELAVLSEAKEEISILKMVFVDHVMDVVSGDQQLTHYDSLLPGGRFSHTNETIHHL